MVTEAQVREALRSVLDPEIGRPIEDIGMLQDIEVDGGVVRVDVLITIEGCPLKDRITQRRDGRRGAARGRRARRGDLAPMSQEQREALVQQLRGGAPRRAAAAAEISFPAADGDHRRRLGQGRRRQVERHGEPRLRARGRGPPRRRPRRRRLGVQRAADDGRPGKPVGFNDMILPLEAHGVKVISMGFFVPEETPVIWRGPMLHKAIEQFLGDVYWGDLDFLLCDLPPGTGDVSHLAGVVPAGRVDAGRHHAAGGRAQGGRARRQDGRAHEPATARRDREHVLLRVPALRRARRHLREGGGQEAADTLGVPLLAQVPLVPALREGGDAGAPIVVTDPDSPASEALREAARAVARATKTKVGKPLTLMTNAPAAAGAGTPATATPDTSTSLTRLGRARRSGRWLRRRRSSSSARSASSAALRCGGPVGLERPPDQDRRARCSRP